MRPRRRHRATTPPSRADASGLVALYVRGGDNVPLPPALRRRVGHGWQNLGGGLLSAPAVVGIGPAIDVFVRGLSTIAPTSHQVTGAGPGAWSSLGGSRVRAPWPRSTCLGSRCSGAVIDAELLRQYVHVVVGRVGTRSRACPWRHHPSWCFVPTRSPRSPLAPGAGLGLRRVRGTVHLRECRHGARSRCSRASASTSAESTPSVPRNRALDSPGWVQTVVAQSWRLTPSTSASRHPASASVPRETAPRPLHRDRARASTPPNDAADRAAGAGLAPGVPIYFDMEGYNGSASSGCVGAVRGFLAGCGSSSSTTAAPGPRCTAACVPAFGEQGPRSTDRPRLPLSDAIWIAAWERRAEPLRLPAAVPALRRGSWPFHQRIHQYQGGHDESYGGVTINIDRNVVDGPLAP